MESANDNLVQVKTCTRCSETKPVTEFYKQRAGKYGVTSRCKPCHSEIAAKYYDENKEAVLERNARWARENPEQLREIMANWYINNRDRAIETHKIWMAKNPEKVRQYARDHAERRSKNPRYRFECAIKTGVRRGITKGSKYGRRTFELLGYTADDLRAHLEKQFKPGMTWENYGEWHVDHKIPLSAFNYETPDDADFKRCWALNNLQPLWAFDNMSKKDKLEEPFQPSLLIATNDNRETPRKERA